MTEKVQKRNAIVSKQLIIQNAIQLFSKKGYAATSMAELATLCDLNKAMIFYYFKNKQGLYESVIHTVLKEIQQTIIKENKSYKTPKDELAGFIRTYAKFAYTHPYLPSLLLKELSDSGAVIPDILFASMRQLFALFCTILARGEAKGYFYNVMPMIIYFMVLGTLNLMITTEPLRLKADKLGDIEIDTCPQCDIDEISEYILHKITIMLEEKI